MTGIGGCLAAWSFATAAMVEIKVKIFKSSILKEKNYFNELAIEFNMMYAESEIVC